MIPKILHFVWIGGKPLPSKYEENMKRWEQYHPGWEIRLWTGVPDDVSWHWITAGEHRPVMLADLVRPEIVHRHGGVYADLDTWPVQSIEPLLCGKSAFVARNREGQIDNPIFGAIAGHPWLGDVLKKIWTHYRPGVVMGSMGSSLFLRTMGNYHDIHVFGAEYLNVDPAFPAGPEAVVMHAADHSWKKLS